MSMMAQPPKKKRKEPTILYEEKPVPAQDLNEIDTEEMARYHAQKGQAGDRGTYSGGIDA